MKDNWNSGKSEAFSISSYHQKNLHICLSLKTTPTITTALICQSLRETWGQIQEDKSHGEAVTCLYPVPKSR